MQDFYEKFSMSKFASKMDRDNAIAQSWQEQQRAIEELEKRNDKLICELSRHQLNAAIGSAVQRASAELPECYELHIELEKDAGTVRLYDQDGNEVDEEFHDCDSFAGAIENAINVAIARSEK